MSYQDASADGAPKEASGGEMGEGPFKNRQDAPNKTVLLKGSVGSIRTGGPMRSVEEGEEGRGGGTRIRTAWPTRCP